MTNLPFAQTYNSGAAGAFFGLGFVFLLLGLLYTCLWIYALVAAATRADLSSTERLIWILILVFLPGIGTLLYLLLKGFSPLTAAHGLSPAF